MSITNGIGEFVRRCPACGEREQSRPSSPLRPARVVDEQDGRRAVLEGVGGLVPRSVAKSAVCLPSNGLSSLVLAGLAAEDQDGLALDVEPGVVVVVEFRRVVLGRDPVAGEDDRHAVERPAACRSPGDEIGLRLGFEVLALRALRGRALTACPSDGVPSRVNGWKYPSAPGAGLSPASWNGAAM